MNDLSKPQTGQLRRDFLKELTLAALPGYQPDPELIARMKDNVAALRAAWNKDRKKLGLKTDEHE